MQLAMRVVYFIALAKRVQTVALARMHTAGKCQGVQHAAHRCNGSALLESGVDTRELRIEECHIESRVVDYQLRTPDECKKLFGNFSEARLACKIGSRNAVHCKRALVDIPLGIEVAMEAPARSAAIDQLDAADLDDAMPELGLESRGLGIQNDLSHGAASLQKQSVDRLIREQVGPLVARHAGVPGNPAPLDLVSGGELVEPLP